MPEPTSTTAEAKNAKDLIDSLDKVSDEDLTRLLEEENAADKPRSTVVEAIEAEQKRREEAAEEDQAEQRYTVDELLANAKLLTGFNRHQLAGGLHGHDPTRKLTRVQASKKAESFLKRKVAS